MVVLRRRPGLEPACRPAIRRGGLRHARLLGSVLALATALSIVPSTTAFADGLGGTSGMGLGLPGGFAGSGGLSGSSGVGLPGTAGTRLPGSSLNLPSIGFGGASSIIAPLSAADAVNFVDSGYNLSDVNPMTGVVDGGSVTSTLSDAVATESQLQQDNLLAINAANLAQQALAQAQAQQRAQEAAQSNGALKGGAVPAPYDQILESSIGSCPGLPIGIAAAQLNQESGFDPNAVSKAGAEGIAQFMPANWQTWQVNADGKTPPSPFDPYDAIPAMIGYDCSLLHAVSGMGGDSIGLMLAAYNSGLGAVQQYGGIPPFAQTQAYVSDIEANASSYATAPAQAAGQTSVSSQGCPSSAPAGTLLDGAPSLASLCSQSVAEARSAQAASAIIYALDHLGDPYSQPLRNARGYYDCSSLVSRAYQSAGVPIAPPGQNAPTTYAIASAPWAVRESLSQAKPGDLEEPTPDHVVMLLADGYVVQAPYTGSSVDVVSNWTASPYLVAWISPSNA